jgi:hypothetical protein
MPILCLRTCPRTMQNHNTYYLIVEGGVCPTSTVLLPGTSLKSSNGPYMEDTSPGTTRAFSLKFGTAPVFQFLDSPSTGVSISYRRVPQIGEFLHMPYGTKYRNPFFVPSTRTLHISWYNPCTFRGTIILQFYNMSMTTVFWAEVSATETCFLQQIL